MIFSNGTWHLNFCYAYHIDGENNINDYGMKGWISIRIAVCFVTGRIQFGEFLKIAG
jgi:hypothetical protein